MEKYIGTKLVQMQPMTRGDYNIYREWDLPKDEDADDEGYLVEYLDGGKRNHPLHKGYISWSPKAQAEEAYRLIHSGVGVLTFGDAVHLLKLGHKVTRAGWNGKGIFLFLVLGSQFKVSRPPLLGIYPEGTEINYRPHIDMKTADGSVSTWNPTCNDVLAEDWMVVE